MEYMYTNVTTKKINVVKKKKKKGGASIIFKKETVNTKFPKDVHKGEFYVSFIFK
jgi:hypothetical protein